MDTRLSHYNTGTHPGLPGWQLTSLMLLILLPLSCYNSIVMAQDESAVILEFDLDRMDFDDSVFRGDSPHLRLTLGYAINPRYEIAYSFSSNFLFTASLSDGPELDDSEDLLTSTRLLYLRRNWRNGAETRPFVLIGYSKVEIESELTRACLLFCGALISTSSTTTYRNEESGMAWGAGLEHRFSSRTSWSIKYIDYTDSDFEFSGIHLGFRTTYGQASRSY